MANVFEIVKQSITTKEAVIHYGMKPNPSGLICCPFHNDKHPSMKVDKRFYCFGCGASGDVIDFVKLYFDLPVKEAAKKLAADFGLHVENEKVAEVLDLGISAKNLQKKSSPTTQELVNAFRIVADYINILKEWKKMYAPKDMNEEWNRNFEKVLVNLTRSEYLEDGLLFGSREEIKEFYECHREEVERIGRRVAEIEAGRNKRSTHAKR